jgi:hypothetical protein
LGGWVGHCTVPSLSPCSHKDFIRLALGPARGSGVCARTWPMSSSDILTTLRRAARSVCFTVLPWFRQHHAHLGIHDGGGGMHLELRTCTCPYLEARCGAFDSVTLPDVALASRDLSFKTHTSKSAGTALCLPAPPGPDRSTLGAPPMHHYKPTCTDAHGPITPKRKRGQGGARAKSPR